MTVFGWICFVILVSMFINDYIRYRMYIKYCRNNNVRFEMLFRSYVGVRVYCYDVHKLYTHFINYVDNKITEESRPDIEDDENFY